MRTYFLRKPQLYLFRILQECLIYIQTAESCIYHTNIKKKQQRLFIVVPKEGPILFPCECHQLHLAECYFVYGDCQYSAQFIQLLELSKSHGIFSMIIDLKICGVCIILGYKLPFCLLIQHDIYQKYRYYNNPIEWLQLPALAPASLYAHSMSTSFVVQLRPLNYYYYCCFLYIWILAQAVWERQD